MRIHGAVFRDGRLLIVVALALGLMVANPAAAQTLNKCSAKKKLCVAKKVVCLLKCHHRAESTNVVLDPACVAKCEDKFDGGATPAKGCFEKLEDKNPPMSPTACLTFDDTASLEGKVDAYLLDVVTELDPGFPAPILNSCSAAKKKCVSKKTKALLKCHARAERKGLPLDPSCVQKAANKFDGGADPSEGCFERLETVGGCLTNDDTATLEAKIDAFVADVVQELDPQPLTYCPSTMAFTASGTRSDFDQGWTGIAHDQNLPTNSRLTFAVSGCAGTEPPCGTCSLSGPVANAGGPVFTNRRCRGEDLTGNNGSWIQCTSNADCPGTGNACVYYFGPPRPSVGGLVTVCIMTEIAESVTGTVDVDTGSMSVALAPRWRVYGPPLFDDPCPRCVAGTCNGGQRNLQPCTIGGTSTQFADPVSLDCPPSGATQIGGPLEMSVLLATGTQTRTLDAASPNCRAVGVTSLKCWCDTCDNLAATPCTSNADCLSVGATICGGRRCTAGSNNGAPCSVNSECPGGPCTIPGEPTRPNACNDNICTPNTPPDNDSVDEGMCADGPVELFCAIQTYRGCATNADCPAPGDTCTTVKVRECFTANGALGDDVSVGGVASLSSPTLGGFSCAPLSAANAINASLGWPGLNRFTMPGTATFN